MFIRLPTSHHLVHNKIKIFITEIADEVKSNADYEQNLRENNAYSATIKANENQLKRYQGADKMAKIAIMMQMRKAWKKLKQLKKQRNPFLNGPNTEENKQLRINRGRDIVAIITRLKELASAWNKLKNAKEMGLYQ